ncbi:MAG: SDR family oxidoreductase [Candidatus Binataceae bacterium]|jgi:NAD(P)-dependent dehydrogenase (short-subunit alcohol dehydrogenase family)
MALADNTVVILGGSSGIGLATAKAAKAEGAHVIITGRSPERLRAAHGELGAGVRTVTLDVQDEAGTRALFGELENVDHVFITAGEIVFDPKLKSDPGTVRPALDTRFWGAFNAAKYAAPKMGAGGSITFMSGTAAIRPLAGAAVGTASCAAVEGFARALAVELAPIRVNTIQPGLVDTPFLDLFGKDRRAALLAEYSKRILVKRPGTAEEIAEAVLFLMKNGFVTGITLTVDGGGVLA